MILVTKRTLASYWVKKSGRVEKVVKKKKKKKVSRDL